MILTHDDAVSAALIRKLDQFNYDTVMIVPEPEEAARLHDLGYAVAVGDFDDPTTYEHVHAERAALVATTHDDFVNTQVAFTARGVAPRVPIVATVNAEASIFVTQDDSRMDVLKVLISGPADVLGAGETPYAPSRPH